MLLKMQWNIEHIVKITVIHLQKYQFLVLNLTQGVDMPLNLTKL